MANAVGERESRDKVSITLREEKRKVLLLNVFKTKHFYYNALIITATVKKNAGPTKKYKWRPETV